MRVALAAYRLMEEVAHVDRGVDAEEAAILAAYRRVLGITDDDLRCIAGVDPAEIAVEGDQEEREDAVRHMAEVAVADDRLSDEERERILAVAEQLGVKPVRAVRLVNEADGRRRVRRAERTLDAKWRRLLASTVALVAIAAAVGWLMNDFVRAGNVALREVARTADPAVVFLRVTYALEKDGVPEPLSGEGEGTGFFVGDGGLIATCKHVVQPWKFVADKVRLIENGWKLVPGSVRYSAWRPGARIKHARGIDRTEAWDSARNTLALVKVAPDRWVKASRALPQGGEHAGVYHAIDNGDLALLRAAGETPPGLELAPADELPGSMDPVVVLGYPRGLGTIEGDRVIGAPSPGQVRRVEDTLLVSCDVYPGNSGGPCLDARGRVVGIAARRFGNEERLARCLKVAHLQALLAAGE